MLGSAGKQGELIREVLLWVPTHAPISIGWSAKTYIQQKLGYWILFGGPAKSDGRWRRLVSESHRDPCYWGDIMMMMIYLDWPFKLFEFKNLKLKWRHEPSRQAFMIWWQCLEYGDDVEKSNFGFLENLFRFLDILFSLISTRFR